MNFFEKLLDSFGADRDTVLGAVLRAAVTAALVAVLIKLISAVFRRIEKGRRARGQRFGYIRLLKYALVALVCVGGVTAMFSGSAKNAVSAVLASSGVAAVVLSIACQEPIGNLCSGVIIILTSPFKIGDVIRHVGLGETGTVEEVTLRHTVIRTFENKRLIIPNSDMNKAAIENSSYGDSKVCFPLEFSITYGSDADAAMQVIRNAIQRHPKYDEEKAEEALAAGRDPVEVLVNRLESSGIVLKVWVWAESLGVSNRMKSDIYLEVRRRFGFAGVEFAHRAHLGADKNAVQSDKEKG